MSCSLQSVHTASGEGQHTYEVPCSTPSVNLEPGRSDTRVPECEPCIVFNLANCRQGGDGACGRAVLSKPLTHQNQRCNPQAINGQSNTKDASLELRGPS